MNKKILILPLLVIILFTILFINGDFEKMEKEKQKQIKKTNLTDYQLYITQHGGTEKPFENEYWDNKEEGIYVDIVTGEPLFSSNEKYDSGSGWPAFTKPIKEKVVKELPDTSLGMDRTEVKSSQGDTHLGHVFNDGPIDQGGQRYCINSASLKFIPKEKLKEEGYEEYLDLFE